MTLWKTVPAATSSRIPTAAQRLDVPVALAPDQCRSLLDDLARIADPRQRRGRRHALGAVLAVAVAAVLAGARSLVAIGDWAADAPSRSWPPSGTPHGGGLRRHARRRLRRHRTAELVAHLRVFSDRYIRASTRTGR